MDRTQKDLDIIRQSSIKAAVELMVGFQNRIELDGTKVVSMTLSVADQFYNWVTAAEAEEKPQGIDYLKLVKDECHKLQDQLGIAKTDWDSPCPFAISWEQGGVQELVQRLRTYIHNQLTGKKHVNAFDRMNGYKPVPESDQVGSAGGNGHHPMTDKQRRYIFALLKETGQKKPDGLSVFTSGEASALIESLKSIQ